MFESLIITLREGIEASLVIGILVSYLNKIKAVHLIRWVYWGVGVAILGSAIGAVVLQMIVINEEAYEGFLYLTAAIFVGTMLFWMWRHAKTIKKGIESKTETLVSDGKKQALGLFLFTFLMIFREGVETVLFLSAVGLTTEKLLSFAGGLLGLCLAVIFCVSFIKGTVQIDLGRFFKVSSAVLFIFVLQLLVNGLHELSEAQMLPSSRWEMALVGPIVRNNALFILAIFCIPILIFFVSSGRKKSEPLAFSGPERRLVLASLQSQQRWRRFWVLASLIIIFLLGTHAIYSGRAMTLSSPLLVESQQGLIKIPLREISDGALHRYGFKVGETLVRFIAIKKGDNQFGTAFDLCEICGDYGYVQEGENVLCLNCIAPINLPSIGIAGGCNPIPLPSSIGSDKITIREEDLRLYADRFSLKMDVDVRCFICKMKLHPEEATEVFLGSRKHYLCSMSSCKEEFAQRAAAYSK